MLIYADQTIREFEKRNRIFKQKNAFFFEILEKSIVYKQSNLTGEFIKTRKETFSSHLIRLSYNQSIVIEKISPRRLWSRHQIISEFSLYQILDPSTQYLMSFDARMKSPLYVTELYFVNIIPYLREFNIKLLEFPKVIVNTN